MSCGIRILEKCHISAQVRMASKDYKDALDHHRAVLNICLLDQKDLKPGDAVVSSI